MGAAIPEFRKPVMTLVEALWQDPSGAWQTSPARMEDKSAGGACIRVKTKIGVGAKLRIQWRFENFSGTAKYCRSEGREYLVGIQRDLAESPNRCRPVPAAVAPQKSPTSGDLAVSTIETQGPPQRPDSKPNASLGASPSAESLPTGHVAIAAITLPAGALGHKDRKDPLMDDRPMHDPPVEARPREDRPRADPPRALSRNFRPLQRTEKPAQKPPQRALKERKSMARKWLEITWRNKSEPHSGGRPQIGDENSNGESDKENLMSHVNQPAEKAASHSAREVPTFQVELSSMDDIYRAAGIITPRKGYSITKVVDMLSSRHMSGLSKEMKRVALLMALDAAGVPIDEVLQDAKTRQQALDSYEAAQKKQVEAEWARKAEEVVQIQAELESIKAHYAARISRNLEGVAREKATFNGWLILKQQESQSMAEAAELCSKVTLSEPACVPPEVSMVKAAAAGAGGAKEESHGDAIH